MIETFFYLVDTLIFFLGVTVQRDLMESNAMKNNLTARTTHVLTELCVATNLVLVTTPAFANLATLARAVTSL